MWRGGRNQREEMVRPQVRVRERGQDRLRNTPCSRGTAPPLMGRSLRAAGERRCACSQVLGGSVQPHTWGGQAHKGGGRTGAPVSLSSLSPHPEGVGRRLGEAGRGRATSLCPATRSLVKTPAGHDPQHCHVLNFLTQKDVINTGMENIHITQKCKGHTTVLLSPWPRPPESLLAAPGRGPRSPGSRACVGLPVSASPVRHKRQHTTHIIRVGLFFYLKLCLGDCSITVQTDDDIKNRRHCTRLLGIYSSPGTVQHNPPRSSWNVRSP